MEEFPISGLPHFGAHNPALINWQQRTLVMYRVEGWGSGKLFLGELDENFQRVGKIHDVVIPGQLECQDPRFFLYRNQLHFSFVTRKNGNQCTGIGLVNDDLSVHDCRVFEPPMNRSSEKNWIFFQHGDDDLYFTYAMSYGVHQVYRLAGDVFEPAFKMRYRDPWTWGCARGGTQLIPHEGLWYGFFHGVVYNHGGLDRQYFMGAYAVSPDPPFPIVRMSRTPLYTPSESRFCGPRDRSCGHVAAVVFPSGLMFQDGSWLVAAGYNDYAAKVFKISHSELELNLISTAMDESYPCNEAANYSSGGHKYDALVHFPNYDRYWMQPLEFALKYIGESETVFGHDRFFECFPRVLPYEQLTEECLSGGTVWVILHKHYADILSLDVLQRLRHQFTAVFANEVFVIFTNKSLPELDGVLAPVHVQALWEQTETRERSAALLQIVASANETRASNSPSAIRVNVGILTHNALEYTKSCVASLKKFATQPYNVFIVDNLSGDGTREWLAQLNDPNVHYDPSAVNLGVAGGRNRLIEIMLPHLPDDGFAVFLDNDIEMTGLWLEPFLHLFDSHPDVGIAGTIGHKIMVMADSRILLPSPQYNPAPVDVVSGGFACWIRTATLKQVGSFDENLGLFWHEDDDYCIRAIAAGWEVFALPNTPVFHHAHKSGAAISALSQDRSLENQLYLVHKWRKMGIIDEGGRVIHSGTSSDSAIHCTERDQAGNAAAAGEECARRLKSVARFPANDQYWMETIQFALKCINTGDAVFAPDVFIEFFPQSIPCQSINLDNLPDTGWLILHKGLVGDISLKILNEVRQRLTPVFANEVFVIFTGKHSAINSDFDPVHVQALWVAIDEIIETSSEREQVANIAVAGSTTGTMVPMRKV